MKHRRRSIAHSEVQRHLVRRVTACWMYCLLVVFALSVIATALPKPINSAWDLFPNGSPSRDLPLGGCGCSAVGHAWSTLVFQSFRRTHRTTTRRSERTSGPFAQFSARMIFGKTRPTISIVSLPKWKRYSDQIGDEKLAAKVDSDELESAGV